MITVLEINTIKSMDNYIKQFAYSMQKFETENGNDGYLIACILLANLEKSFNAFKLLMKSGYFIETNSVGRFIYEQLCYCLTIFDMEFDQIKKVNPTKTIKNIKIFNKEFSKIYGMFSKYVHFEIKDLYKIIDFETDPETKDDVIILKDYKRDKDHDLLGIYIVLTMLYSFVIKHIAEKNKEKCYEEIMKISKRFWKTVRVVMPKIHISDA